MKSNFDVNAVSDGRRYGENDLVRADAGGCEGCSACCEGVGELVAVTPRDAWALCRQLGLSFDALMTTHLTLQQEGHLLLPYLKMTEVGGKCSFLGPDGRCTVHAARPDICRLFPLGRLYEGTDYSYFLQSGACVKPRLEKVKVKKWIGISDGAEYKTFILAWYQLKKALDFRFRFLREEGALADATDDVLNTFYRELCAEETFYAPFHRLLGEAKGRMGVL